MKDSVKKLGNIYGFTGGSYAGNVYDLEGICPAINTCGGGNREPMIVIGSTQKMHLSEMEVIAQLSLKLWEWEEVKSL